jgi:hypothetical protein
VFLCSVDVNPNAFVGTLYWSRTSDDWIRSPVCVSVTQGIYLKAGNMEPQVRIELTFPDYKTGVISHYTIEAF